MSPATFHPPVYDPDYIFVSFPNRQNSELLGLGQVQSVHASV